MSEPLHAPPSSILRFNRRRFHSTSPAALFRIPAFALILFQFLFARAHLSAAEVPAPEGELPTRALIGDGNMWVTAHLQRDLTDTYVAGLGLQARLGNDFGEMRRFRVRPNLTMRVTERFHVMVGYDLIHNFNPNSSEHRLMQQLSYKIPLSENWKLVLRGRMEERFIEGVTGHMFRARTMAQLVYDVPDSPWYVTGWVEGFFNLNMRREWPQNTYAQTRVYAAMGRRMSDHVVLEGGYQVRHTPFRTPRPDQLNHIFFVQIFWDL
jgi:hypothetical protein